MKKALLMVIAVVGLAVPSYVAAESVKGGVFTHEGEPVAETTPVLFTGTAQFTAGEDGVHCENIHVHADLRPGGTGTVTSFEGTGCKTILNGFPTHATPEGLPWKIEAGPEGQATINDIEIHNSVRHPLDTNVEIGTNTLTGHVKAQIGETDATLSNEPGAILVNHEVEATVSGSLTITNTDTGAHTDIGTE